MKRVTIHNLKECSEQEVFDWIARHLLKQNRRSLLGTACRYRTDEGLSCAAGSLFPPEVDTTDFEGLGWRALVGRNDVPADHQHLIARLQGIHDNHPPRGWRARLKHLAELYGLVFDHKRLLESEDAE